MASALCAAASWRRFRGATWAIPCDSALSATPCSSSWTPSTSTKWRATKRPRPNSAPSWSGCSRPSWITCTSWKRSTTLIWTVRWWSFPPTRASCFPTGCSAASAWRRTPAFGTSTKPPWKWSAARATISTSWRAKFPKAWNGIFAKSWRRKKRSTWRCSKGNWSNSASSRLGAPVVRIRPMRQIAFAGLFMLSALQAQQYSRGVGVYPGNPKEDFAAQVVPDTSQAYRNLALNRAAYQSSSYDFNLTAQLATDGIKETRLPRWFAISTNDGPLTRQLREHTQDHNITTNNQLNGSQAWMQFEFGSGDGPPELDRVETSGVSVISSAAQPTGWAMVVRGSDDGQTWTELGRTASADRLPAGGGFGGFGGRGGPAFTPSVALTSPARQRFIRVEFDAPAATRWTIAELILKDKGERVDAGGPYHFSSAWKAATNGGEWLYVDLGAVSTFDKVTLYWLRRPADGVLQSSDDAKIWKTMQVLDRKRTRLKS